MPRRRTVLLGALGVTGLAGIGAAGTALAANGVIPGQARVDTALGFCAADVPPVTGEVGPIVTGSFASTYRRMPVPYRIAYPPGFGPGAKLPVCLMLHGYGGTDADAFSAGDYPAYLAAAVRGGAEAFALAAPAGGNGYWHPHPDDDPLGMLLHEFLPLLGAHGLDVKRPAVSGISMGGFGALLAGLTAPGTFSAIVANSPAFWHSYDEAQHVNAGAFSSAQEWARYGNLLARADAIGNLPVRIYIGSSDPFEPIVKSLDRKLKQGIVHISKGCHDGRFWSSQAPTDLAFVGGLLGR